MTLDLSGVIIPAITPFDPVTGDVDLVGYRSNVRRWLESPVRGVLVAGSSGEAVLLDETEFETLLHGLREVVPADRLLIAGTGEESTRATIRRSRMASEAGCDAVLVKPPAFYTSAMTSEALARHYREVADASPVPVILYQVPLRFATLEFDLGWIVEMANHPKVIGIKDSRGRLDLLGDLVEACPDPFQILVGSGALLYGALTVGATGGILGLANLAPAECAAIHRAVSEGRESDAGALQERIGPVHVQIVGKRGAPGMKRAADLLGFRCGDPRPPLLPLPRSEDGEIRRVLERAKLL